MDPRFQRRVQRYGWDKAQPYYESFWSRQLRPAQRRLLEMADLRPGQRVLDIACGTGLVTFPAAEAVGPAGEVVGTDISQRMVDLAAEKARNRGVGNVRFERGEAETLEFPDASFDRVLCGLGLMYVPDPGAALRECLRVLKPGGRVALAVWGARDHCGWAEVFPITDARVDSEVCPMFFQLGTGDVLSIVLEQAGFRGIAADRLNVALEYDTPEDAAGAAFLGGPVALAYSRFDEPTRRAVQAEYLASIDSYRNGNRFAVPGEYVVASAQR